MNSFQSEITYGLTNEIRHTTEKYGIKISDQHEKEVNTSRYVPLHKAISERTTNQLIIKPRTFLTKQQQVSN